MVAVVAEEEAEEEEAEEEEAEEEEAEPEGEDADGGRRRERMARNTRSASASLYLELPSVTSPFPPTMLTKQTGHDCGDCGHGKHEAGQAAFPSPFRPSRMAPS